MITEAANKSILKVKHGIKTKINIWWTSEISKLVRNMKESRKIWKSCTPENHKNYNLGSARNKITITVANNMFWKIFVNLINCNTPFTTVWKRFKSNQNKGDNTIFKLIGSDKTVMIENSANNMHSLWVDILVP